MSKKWFNANNLLYITIICLGMTLSACATSDKYKRMDLLDITLNDFRKAIRWGYFQEASRYIQVKHYTKTPRDPDYLKDIRITSYEYGKKFLSEENSKLEVSALISFYAVDYGTVHNISDDQIWWFDADKKRWFLDGDIPDLRPQP